MGPEIILFVAAVITKMIFTHREEMQYARQGKDSPRYRLKMAEFRAAQARGDNTVPEPARLGAKGYWRNLWNDLWEDLDAHRARVRKEREDGTRPTRSEKAKALWEWTRRTLNRRSDGRPVDDMVDAAGVRAVKVQQMRTADEVAADARVSRPASHQDSPQTTRQPLDVIDDDPTPQPDDPNNTRYAPTGAAPGRPVPATSTTAPDDRPDATIIRFPTMRENDMSVSSEVTGLASTTAFARASADAHASYSTGGGEAFMGAVQRQGYGPGVVALVAEAQEASSVAAAKWGAVADKMEEFQTGQEFYRDQPDAPEKAALVNE